MLVSVASIGGTKPGWGVFFRNFNCSDESVAKRCPFKNYDESLKGIHWVKPILVAEFQFAQWTKKDKLRVGRYKGLRDDKNAQEVVKEVPKAIVIGHY